VALRAIKIGRRTLDTSALPTQETVVGFPTHVARRLSRSFSAVTVTS